MAIWPFNRNKSNTPDPNLPQEVQDYYQAEKRERVGIAGLLAFGTLVLTVLLALGLFFGGRWLYRTVVDNDNGNETSQVSQQGTDQQDDDQSAEEQSGDQPASQPDEGQEPANQPPPVQPSEPQGQSPATPPAASPAPANPTTTPSVNPQPAGDLPDTGPAATSAVAAAVSAVSSLGYYRLKRPRR